MRLVLFLCYYALAASMGFLVRGRYDRWMYSQPHMQRALVLNAAEVVYQVEHDADVVSLPPDTVDAVAFSPVLVNGPFGRFVRPSAAEQYLEPDPDASLEPGDDGASSQNDSYVVPDLPAFAREPEPAVGDPPPFVTEPVAPGVAADRDASIVHPERSSGPGHPSVSAAPDGAADGSEPVAPASSALDPAASSGVSDVGVPSAASATGSLDVDGVAGSHPADLEPPAPPARPASEVATPPDFDRPGAPSGSPDVPGAPDTPVPAAGEPLVPSAAGGEAPSARTSAPAPIIPSADEALPSASSLSPVADPAAGPDLDDGEDSLGVRTAAPSVPASPDVPLPSVALATPDQPVGARPSAASAVEPADPVV